MLISLSNTHGLLNLELSFTFHFFLHLVDAFIFLSYISIHTHSLLLLHFPNIYFS